MYIVPKVKHIPFRYYNTTTVPVDLSGVFPPIPTPFNKDESIAYDKLASNIQHWEAVPFQGQFLNAFDNEVTCYKPNASHMPE
jgi:hypothetical protein